MNEGMLKIILALIGLLGTIITYVIVPFLKSKTTEKQRDDIVFWVKFAVNAAEQMAKAGIIVIPKKEYVTNFLRDMGIEITDEELNILIEAAVYEINKNK